MDAIQTTTDFHKQCKLGFKSITNRWHDKLNWEVKCQQSLPKPFHHSTLPSQTQWPPPDRPSACTPPTQQCRGEAGAMLCRLVAVNDAVHVQRNCYWRRRCTRVWRSVRLETWRWLGHTMDCAEQSEDWWDERCEWSQTMCFRLVRTVSPMCNLQGNLQSYYAVIEVYRKITALLRWFNTSRRSGMCPTNLGQVLWMIWLQAKAWINVHESWHKSSRLWEWKTSGGWKNYFFGQI